MATKPSPLPAITLILRRVAANLVASNFFVTISTVPLKVVEYIREDGSNPYRNWFDSLNHQAAAKVTTAVLRLQMGNTSRVKWIGTLGEYRIDWGPSYRIYFAQDGDALIVLFGGGTKRRQQDDIRRAEALFSEYKARKAAATSSKGKR